MTVLFHMNLFLLASLSLFTQLFKLQILSDRSIAILVLWIFWNLLLITCYKIRKSDKKHLVFILLFPLKLFLMGLVFILTKTSLNISDTYSWICFLLLNFVANEILEVYLLINNREK